MIFVFQKNIFYIFLTILFAFLLTLPSTQPIEVIGLILFQWAGLEKLGYEQAFQPYTFSLWSFSRGGVGVGRPPQAMHKLRPPSLYWVSVDFLKEQKEFEFKL